MEGGCDGRALARGEDINSNVNAMCHWCPYHVPRTALHWRTIIVELNPCLVCYIIIVEPPPPVLAYLVSLVCLRLVELSEILETFNH
jgi:hypothetical protein